MLVALLPVLIIVGLIFIKRGATTTQVIAELDTQAKSNLQKAGSISVKHRIGVCPHSYDMVPDRRQSPGNPLVDHSVHGTPDGINEARANTHPIRRPSSLEAVPAK
jgi:hypothetical protein